MKRSVLLPIIFSLGLFCSIPQKSEAININPKYKIALVGVGLVAALYYLTTDQERKDCLPITRAFLFSALIGGLK